MESRDQKGAVKRLVDIMRKVTRIVQALPFAYLLLLSVYLLASPFLPDSALCIADSVIYVSTPSMLVLLGAGRLLKLCSWFKTACLLPMATKMENWVDSFVITLTQGEVIAVNVTIAVLAIIYIYLANLHFFHGRKAVS